MRTPLWIPSTERKQQANLTRFMQMVNTRHQTDFKTYADLYAWSVEAIPDFWADMWDFAGIKYSQSYDTVVDDLSKFPGASWREATLPQHWRVFGACGARNGRHLTARHKLRIG